MKYNDTAPPVATLIVRSTDEQFEIMKAFYKFRPKRKRKETTCK